MTAISHQSRRLIGLPSRSSAGSIHDAAPGADEVISYGIPTFRFHGPLVAFSAAKGHASLHLMSVAVKKAHEAEIAPYGTTAATVHFPYDKPLPAALVKTLVRARVAENLEREAHPKKKDPATRRARNPMPEMCQSGA